ncbi:glycosyltransferase [Bacillus haynesii]|uniref:glycosyltransferase family 2 protein n=1 Tax=Bacillus haynesii TaxID=1925021 RepID=UPI00227FEEC7|nr:glycosyltransferase family 2 protein [Bacillus haynesii]MCY9262134.1 glycosyltransferase [Bacillus haynesii]
MLFSIVMPVYNSELYLSEAIESIINQSIDFKKNVEIILIENNSIDNSKKICEEYASQYPTNIKVIFQDKPNVSLARNTGIKACSETSEYIGFIDSDDKISLNAINDTLDFFVENPDINLAVLPLFFFEKKRGEHSLNYRFKKNKNIINIMNDSNSIHYHIGGTFFRKKSLENTGITFNEEMDFWEDVLFINSFLIEEKKYGLIPTAKYFYRKRRDGKSLVDTSWFKKNRYTFLLKHGYFQIINRSIEEFGEVIPYIQFLVLQHLKLFILQKYNTLVYEVLNDEEQNEFFKELYHILEYIDEKVIIEQNMKTYLKEYLISFKRWGYPVKKLIQLGKLEDEKIIITNWKVQKFSLILSASLSNEESVINNENSIYVIYGGKKRKIKITNKQKNIVIWGTTVRDRRYSSFQLKIPLGVMNFRFVVERESDYIALNKVNVLNKIFRKLTRI